MKSLAIALAQVNPTVGDIDGNADIVIRAAEQARDAGAELVVFPELVLTGYPPEDLLLRPSLERRVERALQRIAGASAGIGVLLGYPRAKHGKLYNSAGLFADGKLVDEYAKQHLPNYRVFDEMRYFSAGDQPLCCEFNGFRLAVSICEDIWRETPMNLAREAGADVMLNLNASPFHIGKQQEREALVKRRCGQGAMPLIYVNMYGGQDELVFDGGSLAATASGDVISRAPMDSDSLDIVTLNKTDDGGAHISGGTLEPFKEQLDSVYTALVSGVRDYVNKNGFPGVVLGLSGGIDSGLTLAIAVDALGPERVEAVMMPFKYTSSMSLEDAEAEARALGVRYSVISIEKIFAEFSNALAPRFEGLAADTTEENLQARSRGVLLMAISNKTGSLVLTTGNKSEMAVGYSTLYGDMAGGYDVLKDVSKTLVFDLSRYRNTLSPVIPQRVIDRPPSAELAPDQEDQDTLPDYAELDEILALYIEADASAEAIIGRGFDEAVVRRVVRMVDVNEYKRRQAPIGTRITQRGFGRDRRYPITNRWVIGD